MSQIEEQANGGQRDVELIGGGVESSTTADPPLTDTLIAIPAYNESTAIGSTVLAAKSVSRHVLVVDDGSSDETASLAKRAGATVIEHDENCGKGGAIKTIFQYVRDTHYEALVLIDGDGQHLPEDIPDVVEPVLSNEQEAEMVIGSRYMDSKQTETPLYRRFGQKTLDTLTTGSSGAALTDT